jgi:drug/metabolite transporter (DMT)-like permease
VPAGSGTFVSILALAPPASEDLARAWPYLAALTLGGTVVLVLLMQVDMSRVGPTPAALLSLLEPVVTVILALILLGEELPPARLAGRCSSSPRSPWPAAA